MLAGDADIAVHSMKDVPVDLPEGLHLSVILEREDPRDAFVSNHHASLVALPERAGRHLQPAPPMPACRPPARPADHPLRGNVTHGCANSTEAYDAIIPGLGRTAAPGPGQADPQLHPDRESLPAIGQGAIGIECRTDDTQINNLLAPLHHADTASCVRAERAMNHRLQGRLSGPDRWPCHAAQRRDPPAPGLVGTVDGSEVIRAETRGAEPTRTAQPVRRRGTAGPRAAEILRELYAGA